MKKITRMSAIYYYFISLSGCIANPDHYTQSHLKNNDTKIQKTNETVQHKTQNKEQKYKNNIELTKLDRIIATLDIKGLTDIEIKEQITQLGELAKKNTDAMVFLAALYEEGSVLTKNLTEARRLYKEAAKKNNHLARYYYGLMLIEGRGGNIDLQTAEKYLLENHKNKHLPSTHALAHIYSLQEKSKAVIALLENKDLSLNPHSKYILAISYLQQNKNEAAAIKMLKDAAENNNPLAYQTLGKIYLYGLHHQDKNSDHSFYYLKKAAESDMPIALYDLAVLISAHPELINNEHHYILKILTKAHQLGNENASFEIAKMYDMGNAITQDYKKAFFWYEKSAISGNSRAMYNLASMYTSGDGVDVSIPKATYWLKKSAALGNKRAINILKN